jgi:hypothetical protein
MILCNSSIFVVTLNCTSFEIIVAKKINYPVEEWEIINTFDIKI